MTLSPIQRCRMGKRPRNFILGDPHLSMALTPARPRKVTFCGHRWISPLHKAMYRSQTSFLSPGVAVLLGPPPQLTHTHPAAGDRPGFGMGKDALSYPRGTI